MDLGCIDRELVSKIVSISQTPTLEGCLNVSPVLPPAARPPAGPPAAQNITQNTLLDTQNTTIFKKAQRGVDWLIHLLDSNVLRELMTYPNW